MKIVEQQQRTVTRHFLKIKIAEANSVPAGDKYVDGTTYTPFQINASWHEGEEPESVRITGTLDVDYGKHQVELGYKLDRLPIELEFVRALVADSIED
ncbi:hypothetical protein SEA_TIMINATOR_53 [Arthrobacter phage Timinator]|uniref:Uncharacterized protein n=1 Tax=Arthrobacter phage Timinator TaxID=2024006 RepID=A0A222Z0J8_9CAUD|nr:hypothetical protein SEA_TIMINATOR_53 [Arthrobacter phage Timinator]